MFCLTGSILIVYSSLQQLTFLLLGAASSSSSSLMAAHKYCCILFVASHRVTVHILVYPDRCYLVLHRVGVETFHAAEISS